MSTPTISIHQEQAADLWLPRWARRSHPVVRRQLGLNWRTLAPEYGTLLRIYLFQVLLLAATYLLPFIFNIIVPLNIAFHPFPATGVDRLWLLPLSNRGRRFLSDGARGAAGERRAFEDASDLQSRAALGERRRGDVEARRHDQHAAHAGDLFQPARHHFAIRKPLVPL